MSEREIGEMRARIRELEDELTAARLNQSEWDALFSQVENAVRNAEADRAELEAVKASRSWKLIWNVAAPYRYARSRFLDNSGQALGQ